MTPPLYKVISKEHWELSQNKDRVVLDAMDDDFIHLATEEQLEKVIKKFWKGKKNYTVLKLDPRKLPGKLVFEANPGGTNKYYHLYDGWVPVDAVLEFRSISQ